jgi:hypothetical protein
MPVRQRVFRKSGLPVLRPEYAGLMSSRMAQPISTQQEIPSLPRPARYVALIIMVGGVVLGAAVLLAALVLWFYYGTAVFFEMVASGIGACF